MSRSIPNIVIERNVSGRVSNDGVGCSVGKDVDGKDEGSLEGDADGTSDGAVVTEG